MAAEGRSPTAAEQGVLARWSSWGAIPQVFDTNNDGWAAQRERLRELLSDAEYDAARRTTINAHYTDPAIVANVWDTLRELGFEGGRVLEPGSGAGTFIGMAPEHAQMVGIELDSTTADISRGLYPHADIRTESFADTRFPRGSFDATIGNVPFADVRLHDPEFNPSRHAMHNHFIVKSLELTRPGGFVAVLTSSFTMDATNPAARRDMNALADLVGAVRLPTGAHRRAAGTDVVTDLLILRRRAPGEPKREREWETVTPVAIDGHNVKINTHFADHPEFVLGEFSVGTGMYGSETVSVKADDLTATGERLREALAQVVATARERGDVFTEASPAELEARESALTASTELWDGTVIEADGGFKVARGGALEDLSVPRTQAAETRALLELRDGARDLIAAEGAERDGGEELEAQRAALRARYEAYVEQFGPLGRFTLRSTGRSADVIDPMTGEPVIDPATGEPEQRAIEARITPPAVRRLRSDPHMPLVLALERFDEETQVSAPATMLTQRVIVPRAQMQGADTPSEAIALSMDRTGGVDLELVADLLGVEPSEARTQMGDLVYDDPATGTLSTAPEYLSGDVRLKLEQAEAAAADDDRFLHNVQALRAVQPDPVRIDQIEARLGSVWISPQVHQQFLREILKDPSVKVENPLPGSWQVKGRRFGVLATTEWGTERRPATDIAQAAMEQRPLLVKDTIEDIDGKREVPNPVETAAAQEKAEALNARFAEWVWEDPTRANELAEIYNRRFNSIVLRDYAEAGDYLTLPGLSESFTLRPHQRAAVARMIAEPAVGLFHGVGAGKTLEMVVGTTELRRMGLISKPLLVVPNHMLQQFSREWLQAYPAARILSAASGDLAAGGGLSTADARRRFVARAATNDWDAVIMTQSAFKLIGVSADFERDYIERQLTELRSALEQARATDESMSVKRIEKVVLRKEEALEAQLAVKRDPGLSFEDMGVDYLVVDEAHMYKNLTTVSNIPGAGIDGSATAADLHMKLESLRARYGDRVATLATATPLANSVTEAYVMQRYLRPDLLEAAGVTSFDGWAATFGSTTTEMEVSPAGKFRQKSRFARFQNVPEMLRMWHTFADVKTGEDLDLPVPAIAPRASDGKREVETVVLEPTSQLEDFFVRIGERAEQVGGGVDPRIDNMLKISTDGRKAALDYRLIDESAPPLGRVKLDVVAERILAEWHRTRDNEYLDEVTREPSPIRGGLQLVFSDLGTPHPERWDAYTELRAQLVRGGIASDRVRFIHEAESDAEKARLFAAARAGHVSVLIGSTAKMGVGTNAQTRITAMHHIDCPWRPADVEQRDGRGIRQGNQNAEVSITRYVVERSFDAYSWQTVARKASFIAQIMRGRLDVREIEDIGDTALSAAEAKALASGNPLLLEKANADAELQKLRRQETAHHRAQSALRIRAHQVSDRVAVRSSDIDELRAAVNRTIDVTGDAFTMDVEGRAYDKRVDAAAAIGQWATQHRHDWSRSTADPMRFGRLGGHDLVVMGDRRHVTEFKVEVYALISLEGVPGSGITVKESEFTQAGVGLVTSLVNRTAGIPRLIDIAEADLEAARHELAEAEARLGRGFVHADALEAAAVTVRDIDAKILEQAAAAAREATQEPAVAAEPAAAEKVALEPADSELARVSAIALSSQGHLPPGRRPERAPQAQAPRPRTGVNVEVDLERD